MREVIRDLMTAAILVVVVVSFIGVEAEGEELVLVNQPDVLPDRGEATCSQGYHETCMMATDTDHPEEVCLECRRIWFEEDPLGYNEWVRVTFK